MNRNSFKILSIILLISIGTIIALGAYGFSKLNLFSKESHKSNYTVDLILNISYSRMSSDFIYPVPPSRHLYNKILDSIMEDIRYVNESLQELELESKERSRIIELVEKAEDKVKDADPSTWAGLSLVSSAKLESALARAYVDVSKGLLNISLVEEEYNNLRNIFNKMSKDKRYICSNIEHAIVSWYNFDKHLVYAENWLSSTQNLINKYYIDVSKRPNISYITLVNAYSSLARAWTHLEIAGYLASNIVGERDCTAELERISLSLIEAVKKEIESVGDGGAALDEASRYLSRAERVRSMGLYVFPIVDSLHAYLLVIADREYELPDPGYNKWIAGTEELYRAKVEAVGLLSGYAIGDLRGTVKGILVYRFYYYVVYGDSILAGEMELAASRGLEDRSSTLRSYAYISYIEALVALKNLDAALDLFDKVRYGQDV